MININMELDEYVLLWNILQHMKILDIYDKDLKDKIENIINKYFVQS